MKWFGLVLLVLVVGYFLFQNPPSGADLEQSSDSPERSERVAETRAGIQFIGQNPFNEEYGHADHDAANDLKVVNDLLQGCQLIIKDYDSYFLPENREIVAFLQGKNRDRLAWIPKDHQFVNDQGELVDRWGTPLFFHRESGFQFELRSAGPDQKHWTKDDISTKAQTTN